MEDLEALEIESDRLILLPISLKYQEVIFQEFTDEITRLMYPNTPKNIQETEDFIKKSIRQRNNQTDLVLTIFKKDNQEFLGNCGVHKIDTDTPELGIWLKKSAHGNNFGKEAIHSLKNWADRNLNHQYLLYPVDRKNIPSRKIPESLAGKICDRYQQNLPNGKTLDLIEYRIFPNN
ncbi:MAG: GNAT family N-acetyltransferase [Prochloraceae cyanobacterium]|nr:GNAT family N-acetyltransferase [Prochloraceae cyanobacterium]